VQRGVGTIALSIAFVLTQRWEFALMSACAFLLSTGAWRASIVVRGAEMTRHPTFGRSRTLRLDELAEVGVAWTGKIPTQSLTERDRAGTCVMLSSRLFWETSGWHRLYELVARWSLCEPSLPRPVLTDVTERRLNTYL
jgi:hypothetical protein